MVLLCCRTYNLYYYYGMVLSVTVPNFVAILVIIFAIWGLITFIGFVFMIFAIQTEVEDHQFPNSKL